MAQPLRTRTSMAALAASGLLFAAYQVVRPYADETTMEGARGMASDAWVAAHSFAILGFILLALALPAVLDLVGAGRPPHQRASLLAALGAGLVLPYYGAETFGLHAIGQQVVARNDLSLLALTNTVRYQPVAITVFGVGLVLLAAAGALVGYRLWRSPGGLRWGGLLLAAGLVLFLPQFFAPAPLRIAHGCVLALGCLLVAWSGWRQSPVEGSSRTVTPSAQLRQRDDRVHVRVSD